MTPISAYRLEIKQKIKDCLHAFETIFRFASDKPNQIVWDYLTRIYNHFDAINYYIDFKPFIIIIRHRLKIMNNIEHDVN